MADIVFGKNTNCKERQFFLINSNMIKNYIKLILLPLPPTELVGDILEKRFTLLRRLKILVTTDIKKNFKLISQ